MEEVGAPVAPTIFMSRYCEPPSMTRKRHLPYNQPPISYQHQHQFLQQHKADWNPSRWGWDSVRFVANPMESEAMRPDLNKEERQRQEVVVGLKENDQRLDLNLSGGLNSVPMEEPVHVPVPVPMPVSRPGKRVRSGSPGSTSYPMCQVDSCKEDLSNAKDYHRRHKVCEVHSKATKALVLKQMQRFCQQCSRFTFFFFSFEGFRLRFLPLTVIVFLVVVDFTPSLNSMRERGVAGEGLPVTIAEEGKPSQRMLPQGC